MRANRLRFSSAVPQWQVSIALCSWQRRFAVAKAGERSDVGRKTGGIRRISVKRIDQSFGIVGGGDEIVHDAPSQQG